jgi:hypothetical protein
VDYADTEVFVRDIREPEKKDDAEDTEGSDSSQDQEETEDAGNARAEVLEQGSARPEVMAPSLLLDPALPNPMSPLPQLHLPAALLLPLPLKLCTKNTLSFIRSPVCQVQL